MNEKLYCQRFAFERSRPVQLALAEIASGLESPGILVLEAAMGVGKIEAALVAAEILAAKTKHKGIFFALPSQATSDAIFPRIANWVSKLDRLLGDEHYSLRLMPGKAEFNDHYCKLSAGANVDGDEENAVFVHSWFAGRKRSMLDDFVVGTIDQLLLAALKHKHLKLRHLGLANKIIIIDQCHAYDAYMSQYLHMVLSWLGAYRVAVIVLSATLPLSMRKEVVCAYLGKNVSQMAQEGT
jgi:CRISPR-associated endonuclease/helicase Cas3